MTEFSRTTWPGRRATDPRINLKSNELIHPAADEVLRHVATRLDPSHLRRYPALMESTKVLAAYFSRSASECVVTPGSDSAIRLICDAFARNGGKTVFLQAPNYDAWEQAAHMRRLSLRAFTAPDASARIQLRELLAAAEEKRGALIALSTPNGPTGDVAPQLLLNRLIEVSETRGHLLVIDACYQAFHGPLDDQMKRISARTLIVQTFSKSHGLAGARVSLLFGTPERLAELDAWPLEQMVASASHLAACVAIEHHEVFREIWSEIREVRQDTATRLRGWGINPLPSGGNFLTIRVGDSATAAGLIRRLSSDGYRIRNVSELAGLEGCIRFTIGDWNTTRAFLSRLEVALERISRQ